MNSKFIVLFLASAAIFMAAEGANLASLCNRTKYPIICRQVVEGKSSAVSATSAAINLLIRKSTEAKSLSRSTGAHTDKFSKQLLDTCSELYDDTISGLKSSLRMLKSGDKNGLNSQLSAVLSNIVACDDGFLGAEQSPLGNGDGHPNPLIRSNSRMTKLASTALVLSEAIH